MPFVAGNDIDAHCEQCSKDTVHIVIEVHAGVVQEVRCKDCKDKHPYKKPHSIPKPKKTAKKVAKGRRTTKKSAKQIGPPQEWQDKVMGCDPDYTKPYGIKETFELNDIIDHKKFGLGIVTAIDPDGKIEVAFREDRKKLVHNRI